MNKRIAELIIVTTLLGLSTIFISIMDLDLKVARLFIQPDGRWIGKDQHPWSLYYQIAAKPGFVIALCGLFIFIGGFYIKQISRFRKAALFFVLLLLLGPGLIVNVVFKDNWGRARPHEIQEFGGQHQYTECWMPGKMGPNSSFPSGHASSAFYMIAPWFVLRKKNVALGLLFLSTGLLYGGLIGYTRIVQGGHFLTDVIWSAGIVYLVGLLLSWLMKLDNSEQTEIAS